MIECKICYTCVKSVKSYVEHCRIHANVPNIQLPCCFENCSKSSKSYAGLMKHIACDHTTYQSKRIVHEASSQILPDDSEMQMLPPTPALLFEGDEFYRSTKHRVVINRHVMCTAETPLTAFAFLFGSYFLFNLCYPADAGATLELVQHVFLGINPSLGTKVRREKGKKTRSGVHELVLAFVRDLAESEALE